MEENGDRCILWSARDITLPESLWGRLKEQGYKVLLADGEEDSLARIGSVSPCLWVREFEKDPDSEMGVLRVIRTRYPDLPIVVISRNPTIEEAAESIKTGASDYLPEGVSQERLWATLEGALRYPVARSVRLPGKKASEDAPEGPIAVHPAMVRIIGLADRIAPSRSTVLIQGESGTGKEVIARYIHRKSDRRERSFIGVNCAALPETLLESELFGHEKGAFTGAVSRKKGKFELADGGTLLLDEISEMAVPIQAKLLRVLQEREVDRIGGQSAVAVDTRIVATTNRDLAEETRKGNFRVDLFYRLNVVPLMLPPLRERQDDIVPLAAHFLARYGEENRFGQKRLSSEAEAFLTARRWPGNVRELENLMERATLLIDADVIGADDLEAICVPDVREDSRDRGMAGLVPLKEMEKKMISRALHRHGGNRTHAAKVLGISVRTLRNKLHEYGKDLEGDMPSAASSS
ncbi:MAG: sigma-54-dependent Fis family transcriptional regulator [Deltaproteobacteria bacterium]|nr:sigma-54-dependent Fis family transcriptional regulator [Deltaproteobacteria bacterium]